MAVPLSINNPQSEEPIASISPTITGQTVTYSGNVIGSGSSGGSSAASGESLSTILIYGAIALFVVWILQRIGES